MTLCKKPLFFYVMQCRVQCDMVEQVKGQKSGLKTKPYSSLIT
uniref:Uncharacterized protein n=1 Tax=Anguilla anguilla TaxID=7936 RepID=A0A0E9S0R4_ANGAN